MNIVAVLATLVLTSVPPSTDAQFSNLQQVLEQYGFEVRLASPPKRGAYGLLENSTKVIWINPVVFELGIARPTLVHEAVHAAQSCSGGEDLRALNLEMTPPPQTRRFFLRYHSIRRQLEAEAYTVQVQPDGVEKAITLLHQHCQ
ncbi:MAG: hypothetical protein F6K58_26820 [Symploca sp. SIO2E9]|nr:hypothetical protein [Symploca sp. SIO2E9]